MFIQKIILKNLLIIFILNAVAFNLKAQLIEVQANYNGIGNVDFVAHNNSKAPLFLNIDFADLENTVFNEPIPYVKQIEPGFNRLFTLERYANTEPPRFNYKIKFFRSHPLADVNLDFPYLIPFQQNSKIKVFDVRNIDGFWGVDTPKSWHATGFDSKPGTPVYACRNGIVVEIAGQTRSAEPETWYNAWNNTITILQPDGTLICYHNVIDKSRNLKPNTKIYAGQIIGEVAPESSEMIVMIYHNTLNENKELIFIIPEFVVAENKSAILNSAQDYTVYHPLDVIGKEMNAKEKKKYAVDGRK